MNEDRFWETLETLRSNCIQRYEDVLNEIESGKLLSQIELVMLQHQLYKDVCETSISTKSDLRDQTELSASRILESRLAALKEKHYNILITGKKKLLIFFKMLEIKNKTHVAHKANSF